MRVCLVTVGLMCLFAAFGAMAQESETFYVSPHGNDAWTGTQPDANAEASDGPFASLERAVEAVRQSKASEGGKLGQPVDVVLRGGTHFVSEPLVLGPDVSGTWECSVRFIAHEGEKPIISGGRRIEGWKKLDEHLWGVELEAVKKGDWNFRTLRVGDEWATRARYPNADPADPIKGGWLFAKPFEVEKKGGYFGAGMANIHNKGDRIEWKVDVPAAGEYTVWLWYGHKMLDYGIENMDDRTRFGVVDGESALLKDLPHTGNWNAVRWAKAATLSLPAGAQRLFWENVVGGGMNLDAFCLTDDPEWRPGDAIKIPSDFSEPAIQPPAEGKHLILFQAEDYDKAVGPEIKVSYPKAGAISDRLIMGKDDFPAWQDWTGAELHIFPAWGWVNTITAIHGADAEKHLLNVKCPQDIRTGNRYFIAGVREALDSPGEWHLDRETGMLVYWPKEEAFPNVEVIAPVHDTIMMVEGDAEGGAFAGHVEFEGLTFMDSQYTLDQTYNPSEAAIVLSHAEHCAVNDCTFTLLGGYAVRMEQQSAHNGFVHNTVTEVGQGGVILLGDAATQPHDNLIVANTMTDLGRIYKHVAAAYVTTGSGNTITHNRIHRVPRYGISLKSFSPEGFSHNNLVEFNEIIDSNLETNDTGAIETLGRDKQNSGNIIRYNLLRNVVGLKTSPEGEIMSPYFTWGIYLDDYSSGTLVYGNIVDGTVIGGFCIHGGKDNRIENNIFFNASQQQLRLQPRDDFMHGNTFLHNIVAYHAVDSVLWYSYDRTWQPDRLSACDNNVYWCYDDLDIASTDKAITPEGTFAQWKAVGLDEHSVVADPQFVSPELEHFGLKADSPALKLGHKPIAEDKIGPEGYGR